MRCVRSPLKASPVGDRSLCATYHILGGVYKGRVRVGLWELPECLLHGSMPSFVDRPSRAY